MKAPTLSDVARAAGVSYATADRVVNRRGSVSERARGKVGEAVAKLGYVRNVAAANLSQGRAYRFVFLLPDGPNAFFQSIRRAIARQADHLGPVRVFLDVQDVSAFSAPALRDELVGLAGAELDGVAIVGLDADTLIAPVQALREAGKPVVSLVSDLPAGQSEAYIGIDNLAAGRTAARLLGLAHGGRGGVVQVLAGDLAARDHNDRLNGFREVMDRDFPALRLLPVIEGRDDSARVETAISGVLDRHSDLSAIYSLGAGNSGLVRALQGHSARPLVAVHELVRHSRAALESGLIHYVIDQRPEEEIEAALNLMRALADKVPPPPAKPILPTIHVRDNLPPTNGDDSE